MRKSELMYLAFCDHCGQPKILSKPIMETYVKKYGLDNLMCNSCGKRSDVPVYFKTIINELIDTI